MSTDAAADRPHSFDEIETHEQWQFDFWDEAKKIGGWVHFGWNPQTQTIWYVTIIAGVQRRVTLVAVPDISTKKLSRSLEFRAEGIWAHHVCEKPLEHWTVGLEAFGVVLDSTEGGLGNQWGERIGVGLDLEWESAAPPVAFDEGFQQKCSVSGELLIGSEDFQITATGSRMRSWGSANKSEILDHAIRMPIRLGTRSGDLIIDTGLNLGAGTWSGGIRM